MIKIRKQAYWGLQVIRKGVVVKNMTMYDSLFKMLWHFIYEDSWLENLIEKIKNKYCGVTHRWSEPLQQRARSVTIDGACVDREVKVCKRCGKVTKFVLLIAGRNLSESHYDPFYTGKCERCNQYDFLAEENSSICIKCGEVIAGQSMNNLINQKLDELKEVAKEDVTDAPEEKTIERINRFENIRSDNKK